MRIDKKSCDVGSLIYRILIMENTLQPRIQLLSQVIENIVYVGIINGVNFSSVFPAFSKSYTIFITLAILCLAKFYLKVAFRFGILLIILQMIVQNGDWWTPVNCIFLIILSIGQLIGSISFDYGSEAVYSQSKVENKVMRLVLLMSNVGLLAYVQNDTYIHLASAVLFLGLFINKASSLIKNQSYKEIAFRFYLWVICEHLRLFINSFISTSSPQIFIIAFLISQAIFSLIEYCRGTVNCHQLLAKEERLKLAFILLRYEHSSSFDPQLQKFVENFIEDSGQSVQLGKAELHQNDRMNSQRQRLSHVVLNLLEKSGGFLEAVLRAQIHAQNGSLLVAIEVLAKVREQLSSYKWLCNVLLLRAQERILNKFQRQSSCVILAHEKQWLAYLTFQSLIHKAAAHHLRLSLYLKKTEIELAKVKEMCAKIIAADSEAIKMFEQIRNEYSISTQLFVSFLTKVCGDFIKAEQILSRQILREKHLLDGGCQQKLYIRLGLSAEGLTISRIGFNSRLLLGFNRADLEGQKIQRLVPSFFRNQHQRISTNFIRETFIQAYLFEKKTIILNGHGNYNICSVVLKLRLQESGLGDSVFCFQGYLRVTPTYRHNLSAMFIVDARGVVIESTDGLFQDQQGTSLKVQQLFKGNIGDKLIRINKQQLYEIYQPIMSIKLAENVYFYAKQLERKRLKTLVQGTSTLNEMATPLIKPNNQPTKPLTDKSDQIQSNIRSKQVIFLFTITIILILCLFGSEYLLIASALVKYNNQKFAVLNFMNLIQYYNATQTLNLNMVYVNLRDNYNYTNSFTVLTMEDTAAKMQSLDEKLKQFNMGKYKLPSYNPQISYLQSNYELIMMLVSENILYRKFSSDSFAKKMIMDQSKLVTPVITMQSITDFRASIFNLMTSFVQNDIYYQQLSLGVSLANILVFIFVAFIIFWKLRTIEEYTLSKRCQGTFYLKKIDDIINFMKQITLEQMGIDKLNEQMHVFQRAIKPQDHSNNSSYLQSQGSLIKEVTGRNMMSDTLNRTGFLDDLEKAQNIGKPQNSQTHTFIKGNSHSIVLVSFGIFIAILVGLDVANEIINYQIKNVDEVNSLNSVLSLYKANGYYTSRGVILTLNTMLLRNQKGVDNSASYSITVQTLYNYLAGFSLPVFPETKFSQFSDFKDNLTLLYQAPICSYIACQPQFQNQINLNFISVINKYAANLSIMVKTTSNYTQLQFATYISTNKHYIDLVLYTEMILRGFVTNLMMLYLDSYVKFMDNLYENKLGYIFTMMAITGVGLALFVLFIWVIKKEQRVFIRMIRIYQEPITEQ